jgi:hypothetical protein
MTEQTAAPKSPARYCTVAGYGYKRPESGRWVEAETVVLPTRAVGCTKVYGFVTIDGARCVVFQTPAGRYAQTVVATQQPERDMVPVEFIGVEEIDASPETAECRPVPASIALVWAEEAVAKAGPAKGRVLRTERTVYVPREVFDAAIVAWKEGK